MSARWSYADAIAREMAAQRTFGRVLVRDPLRPADVAGDIHARLAFLGRGDSICIHVQEGLERVHSVALEHADVPLVVTTTSTDWQSLVDSRRWCDREGSLMFVLSQHVAGAIDPQVITLLSAARSVFVSGVPRNDPRAATLLREARELLTSLMSTYAYRLRVHSRDIGLDDARINFQLPPIDIAAAYLDEAERSQLLIPAFERLRRDYPRAEVDEILRAMRALYLDE